MNKVNNTSINEDETVWNCADMRNNVLDTSRHIILYTRCSINFSKLRNFIDQRNVLIYLKMNNSFLRPICSFLLVLDTIFLYNAETVLSYRKAGSTTRDIITSVSISCIYEQVNDKVYIRKMLKTVLLSNVTENYVAQGEPWKTIPFETNQITYENWKKLRTMILYGWKLSSILF